MEHPTKSPPAYGKVLTPKGESVRVRRVGSSEYKALRASAIHEITDKKIDGMGRKTFLLPNGEVLYKYFVTGEGLAFPSRDQFEKALDFTSYLQFGLVFHHNSPAIKYYWFDTKIKLTEALFARPGRTRMPQYDTQNGEVYRLSDGAFFYALQPHKNSGNWFPSEEHFQCFAQELLGTWEEPTQEPVVRKRLVIDNQGAHLNIYRYNETSFEELKPLIASSFSLPEAKNNTAHRLIDGRVVLTFKGLYLLFASEEDFQRGKTSFQTGTTTRQWIFDEDQMHSFAQHKAGFKQHLEQILGLPDLQWDIDGLRRVGDEYNRYFASPLFLDLVWIPTTSFLGEVFRSEKESGEWNIVRNDKGKRIYFEPVLFFEEPPKRLSPFRQVLKVLNDQEHQYKSCLDCIFYSSGILYG